MSDPLGNSTGITYDSAGRITKVNDPLSHGYDIAYTNGLVSTVTNPSPFQAQYQSFGYGDDTQTTFTQSYRDRRGKYWYYTFTNPGANLTTFKNPLNQTQNWTYDSSHNRLTYVNGLSRTWTYSYDSKGNVLTSTDPLSNLTSYTYQATFNKVTQRTDPDEVAPSRRVWSWTYDSATGNLLTQTDPNSKVITYVYYSASDHPEWLGLPKSRTDRVGLVTNFEYDSYGQMNKRTDDPSGLNVITQYENDAAGRRTATIDPRSSRTEYTFDAGSRLTQVKVDAGTGKLNLTTAYTYDAAGRQTQVTNPRGTVTQYTYNELDRLTKVTQDYGTNKLNYYTFYTYDANGNRTVQTDPNAKSTNWAYDDANRNTTVTDANGKVTTNAYDAAGNP